MKKQEILKAAAMVYDELVEDYRTHFFGQTDYLGKEDKSFEFWQEDVASIAIATAMLKAEFKYNEFKGEDIPNEKMCKLASNLFLDCSPNDDGMPKAAKGLSLIFEKLEVKKNAKK